jgi:hypothetical protein
MPIVIMCAGCFIAYAGHPQAVSGYYRDYMVYKKIVVNHTVKKPVTSVNAR